MITLYSLTRIPVRFSWPNLSKPEKIKPGLFTKVQLAKQTNNLIIVFYAWISPPGNHSDNLDSVVAYIKDKYSWISHCHILVGDVPYKDDTIDNLIEFDFYRKVQAALPDIPVTLHHPQNLNGELSYADSWLYEWLAKFRQTNLQKWLFAPSEDDYVHPVVSQFKLDFRGHNYAFDNKLSCLINRTKPERSYLATLLWDLDCTLTYRETYINYSKPKFQDKRILKKYNSLLPTVSKHFGSNELIEKPDHLAVTILQALRLIEKSFCNVVIDDPYWSHVPRITEKTCKPILATRPWIFAGSYNTLAWLQEQGFKTFSRWWDESYDQEPDHWRRLEKVYRTAEFVNSLSVSDCASILAQMQPTLEHNYQHLTKKFVHRTTANLFK